MLDTYILKIDNDIGKDDFNRLLSYVSEEKKEKILRYYRFEDAQRSLLGDILARYAICKRTGVNNSALAFRTNEYGKPVLLEPHETHFNISHSENWVVCAIDDKPVGIDVETIKPIHFKIAETFFSRDEYLSLIKQPEEMRLKYFYMIWTLKESYIKAEGKGLSIPLNTFSIEIDHSNILLNGHHDFQGYSFYQHFLNDDTIVSTFSFNKFKGSVQYKIGDFLDIVIRMNFHNGKFLLK